MPVITITFASPHQAQHSTAHVRTFNILAINSLLLVLLPVVVNEGMGNLEILVLHVIPRTCGGITITDHQDTCIERDLQLLWPGQGQRVEEGEEVHCLLWNDTIVIEV